MQFAPTVRIASQFQPSRSWKWIGLLTKPAYLRRVFSNYCRFSELARKLARHLRIENEVLGQYGRTAAMGMSQQHPSIVFWGPVGLFWVPRSFDGVRSADGAKET
jgi:hypothetical protein